MVTKWNIPCSVCGKTVSRYIFCSGACKVEGHRARQRKNVQEETLPMVTEELPAVKVATEEKKGHYKFSPTLNENVWVED